jgi:hypothetical protein
VGNLGKIRGFWIFGYKFLFIAARTSPFDMSFSLRSDMKLQFCTDGFPRVSRVRRWRYDPYQRVALGGFSTPCVGSTQRRRLPHTPRLTRCPSLSAMASPVAEWLSLFCHTRTTLTGSTWVLSNGDSSLTRPLSQPSSECWQTSVTTTPQWLLSLRLDCFLLWVLTTQHGWTEWITYRSRWH